MINNEYINIENNTLTSDNIYFNYQKNVSNIDNTIKENGIKVASTAINLKNKFNIESDAKTLINTFYKNINCREEASAELEWKIGFIYECWHSANLSMPSNITSINEWLEFAIKNDILADTPIIGSLVLMGDQDITNDKIQCFDINVIVYIEEDFNNIIIANVINNKTISFTNINIDNVIGYIIPSNNPIDSEFEMSDEYDDSGVYDEFLMDDNNTIEEKTFDIASNMPPSADSIQKSIILGINNVYNRLGIRNPGLCAKYTINHITDIISHFRTKKLNITSAPKVISANNEMYFNQLKILGYVNKKDITISKSKLMHYLNDKTNFKLLDIVSYYPTISAKFDPAGLSKKTISNHMAAKRFGHTQLFVNGIYIQNKNWLSDVKTNYNSNFVYQWAMFNEWTLKHFRINI